MRVYCHAYLRKRGAKDSKGTIYIRITCERLHTYVNTFVYLDCKFWNAKKERVLPSHPECIQLNDLISAELGRVRRGLIDSRLKGNDVNHAAIKQVYGHVYNYTALGGLIERYNETADVCTTRKRHMSTAYRHAIAAGVPDEIEKIKPLHLHALRAYLVNDKALQKNTVISILNRFKTILNFAITSGVIEKNPFAGVKIGEYQPNIKFLSLQEIEALQSALPGMPAEWVPVCKGFLFSCFTGLRFGDLMNLDKAKVMEGPNGKSLYFTVNKTLKKQFIPLLPAAVALLPDVTGLHLSNQHFNRVLKLIGKAAGIETALTSHLARHTFATVGLNKGITLDSMQKFLGHADIKTTQGYAHLMQVTQWEQINKFNN